MWAWITIILSGCVGGLRTVMISNFSLTPPPPGIRNYEKYYIGLNASSGILDDALLLQLYSGNFQDMADKEPIDMPYQITGIVSSKIDGISIDLSSFVLDHLEGSPQLNAQATLTSKRATIKLLGRTTLVCDFLGNAQDVPSSIAPVPKYDGMDWPPQGADNSILCISLKFGASIRVVSPEQRFQLHFRYFVRGVPKKATLYFYPIKYHYFQA